MFAKRQYDWRKLHYKMLTDEEQSCIHPNAKAAFFLFVLIFN